MVQNFAKRRNGFRHFGEVNYSYPRQVVHCEKDEDWSATQSFRARAAARSKQKITSHSK